MRIHSDIITTGGIYKAARVAGARVFELTEHKSKSRERAFNFYLTGHSSHGPGYGRSFDGEKAATWDEWGMFLNHLYEIDPNMHTGKHGYQEAEHFHWLTGDRFRDLVPSEQHLQHKWNYGVPNVTGRYSVTTCRGCTAIQRWLLEGTWETMQDRV